jgi:hypothetical protein
MTVRTAIELFGEVCALALVVCSLTMILVAYLLLTGAMP